MRQVWRVEATEFHFYDTLKILLSLSALQAALEQAGAT